MPVKTYRPLTPSRRFYTVASFAEITKSKPEKSLVVIRKKTGGRNVYGRVTARGIGGGHKQKIRLVDFKRRKFGMDAVVVGVEYDPCRSARIALVQYADGEKRYILAPLGVKVGDSLLSGARVEIRPGNSMPLKNIPLGTTIHNIEIYAGRGGQLVRSAGVSAQLMAKDHPQYATIRLPSGEERYVSQECMATIGQVGNVEHGNIKLGKAGRNRHKGIRPSVRGSVMSPRDHPHGGGEGTSPIGMAAPKTPWGKVALGKRTRNNKATDKYIFRRRGKKRR